MKHSIKVKGKVLTIELFVSVIDNETFEVVDEGFDSIREASSIYPRSLFYFRWSAALVLDKFGNLDFPFHANTKQRAISNLKKHFS